MSIKTNLTTVLSTVLANTWAIELPVNATYPALVFDIETTPEQQWVLGGGYDQHTVTVLIYAKTLAEIDTLKASVDTALEAMAGYMLDGDRGDANYEDDASIYAYYCTHVIRLNRSLG